MLEDNNNIVVNVDEELNKNGNFLGTFLMVIGVLMIVFGAIYSLMLIGIPMIFVGINMYKAGDRLKQAMIAKDGNELKSSIIYLSKASKIYIIAIIVSIVVSIIFLIIFFGIAMAAANRY